MERSSNDHAGDAVRESARICPDCGASIPSDAPAGLCIACVLALAQQEPEFGNDGSASARNLATRKIGNYDLLREIGRGGMGVVYEARQRSLNRTVALKLILAGEFASEAAVARFREEAELIASLSHPNIVPVFEIGEHQGFHFYSMKLIAGPSLAERIAVNASAAQSTLRESAALIAKIARAVHFAHQRGIIHRDLSPENVLLEDGGEPCVTDFGMARLLDRDRSLTQTRVILGRPDYMAPEQTDSNGQHLTTACDIFSLGAILYELITGRPPFAAASPLSTLERVRNAEPVAPSRLNRSVDRDLETISLKCLSKDPGARYESAASLADDLERWMRGEPILARPVNALEASWKWIRRHPTKSALLGVGVLAVLGPLITTFALYFFFLPKLALTHQIVGADPATGRFTLPFEPRNPTRATLNFDSRLFQLEPGPVQLYFTNISPEHLSWFTNRECRVFADIPGADDQPRSPPIRHGDIFAIAPPQWRDRAFYVAPLGGWNTEEALHRAREAKLCIAFLNGPPKWPEE